MTTKKDLNLQFLPPYWILSIVALVLLIWLLVTLKEMVALLVVGLAVSYLIEPAVVLLEKYQVRRPVGIVAIGGAFLIFIIILVVTVIPVLFREYEKLVHNFPEYIEIARLNILPLLGRFQDLPVVQEFLASPTALLSQIGPGTAQKILNGLMTTLLKGYSLTLTIVNLALLPFIIFYMSADFPSISERFIGLIPQRYQKKTIQLLNEMNSYVSGFVRGQILICTVLFFLYALGLGFMGVELWFLLAIVAGYGNMIPYLGFLVGIVLASIMTLVTYGDWQSLLMVWGLFGLVQTLESFYITPKILGDRVGLSPLVIILALVIAGKLFGLIGVLLAVPAAAILKVLMRHGHTWFLSKV